MVYFVNVFGSFNHTAGLGCSQPTYAAFEIYFKIFKLLLLKWSAQLSIFDR